MSVRYGVEPKESAPLELLVNDAGPEDPMRQPPSCFFFA
jgi:hypothetical protein